MRDNVRHRTGRRLLLDLALPSCVHASCVSNPLASSRWVSRRQKGSSFYTALWVNCYVLDCVQHSLCLTVPVQPSIASVSTSFFILIINPIRHGTTNGPCFVCNLMSIHCIREQWVCRCALSRLAVNNTYQHVDGTVNVYFSRCILLFLVMWTFVISLKDDIAESWNWDIKE